MFVILQRGFATETEDPAEAMEVVRTNSQRKSPPSCVTGFSSPKSSFPALTLVQRSPESSTARSTHGTR